MKKIRLKTKKIIKIYQILLAIMLPLMFVEIVMLIDPSIKNAFVNTVTLATTVKPETFTELYIDNHLQLPTQVNQGQTIHFSFTVHNLEYQQYTYPYEVYIDENGQRTPIDTGTFSLPQHGYKTISESYTFNKDISRARVVINLIQKNQKIFFWMNGKDIKS